jgi:transcriptional regulator with XRE-family HTH domain
MIDEQTASARFAARMRQLREHRGITQKQLADHLGLSRTTITMVEHGHQGISLNYAARIADFLGVSLDELVNADEETIYERRAATVDVEIEIDPGIEVAGSDLEDWILTMPGRYGWRVREAAFVRWVSTSGQLEAALAQSLQEQDPPPPVVVPAVGMNWEPARRTDGLASTAPVDPERWSQP